jgi:excisionase family DNA binding protein
VAGAAGEISDYVDIHTAAKWLGVSFATLRRRMDHRQIPFYRFGGRILFRISEINEHLNRNCRVNPKV